VATDIVLFVRLYIGNVYLLDLVLHGIVPEVRTHHSYYPKDDLLEEHLPFLLLLHRSGIPRAENRKPNSLITMIIVEV